MGRARHPACVRSVSSARGAHAGRSKPHARSRIAKACMQKCSSKKRKRKKRKVFHLWRNFLFFVRHRFLSASLAAGGTSRAPLQHAGMAHAARRVGIARRHHRTQAEVLAVCAWLLWSAGAASAQSCKSSWCVGMAAHCTRSVARARRCGRWRWLACARAHASRIAGRIACLAPERGGGGVGSHRMTSMGVPKKEFFWYTAVRPVHQHDTPDTLCLCGRVESKVASAARALHLILIHFIM